MQLMSELKLQQASLEREILELKNGQYNNNIDQKKPPLMPRMSSQPQLTSTPISGNQVCKSPQTINFSSFFVKQRTLIQKYRPILKKNPLYISKHQVFQGLHQIPVH